MVFNGFKRRGGIFLEWNLGKKTPPRKIMGKSPPKKAFHKNFHQKDYSIFFYDTIKLWGILGEPPRSVNNCGFGEKMKNCGVTPKKCGGSRGF